MRVDEPPFSVRPLPAAWLWGLAAAAAARLLLQVLAMPPYAGLDEGFHVARVSFVAVSGHQPAASELSVAGYFSRSFNGLPGAVPAFGTLREKWPEALAARPLGWSDVPLDRAAKAAFVATNYQAQQASLYYALAAPLDRVLGTSQLRELLVLRLPAVPLGVVTVLATGLFAAGLWGPPGFLAGLFLVATPTWITLVARAGNDALACAALAVGVLLSSRPGGGWGSRVGEAGAWAIAIATKLYAWPAALLLPLLWPGGSSRGRRLFVGGAAAVSAALTALDLAARTGTPSGKFELWSGGGASLSFETLGRLARLPWPQYAKVFVGSAIWTSGAHFNFLRGPALGLFLLPWLLLGGVALVSLRQIPRRRLALLAAAAASFAAAELAQSWGALQQELAAPRSAGTAGLAGWYVHALDPIWVGVGVGFAVTSSVRRGWRWLPAVALAGAFAADLFVTEGALLTDYAGLSSPTAPGPFFRWGGGDPWDALVRLGRYGLWLPSPWLAVGLRLVQAAAFAAVTAAARRSPGPSRARAAGMPV
ncbi:MAG TPA: hypothetical protein VMN82_01590 [Thermoanaerobaculia bacterium]|nr:hypothetical protein [Thermoanaerobaculia bacterium]